MNFKEKRKKTTRRFLGKTEGFQNKAEQRLEQKHLRAYLKGYQRFRHGYDPKGDPIWHTVKQMLTT